MSATPFAEQIYPTVKQALLTIQNISQQKHVFDPTSLKSLKSPFMMRLNRLFFQGLLNIFKILI